MSLLQTASRFDNDIEPLVCHIYSGDRLRSDFERKGIRVASLHLTAKYGFGPAIRGVRRLVLEEEPDLIVTTLYRADVVGRVVGKMTGVPVVSCFVNDEYSAAHKSTLGRVGRMKLGVFQMLDRVTGRWVTHFLANSDAVARSRGTAIGATTSRVSVIHRGRRPAEYDHALEPDQLAAYRDEFDLPEDVFLFLNVGRLVESKGQAEVICAFATVAEEYPSARLLIAGDGPHRSALEQVIENGGLKVRVRLIGSRSDIPGLLALADAFVFPSRHEGHPGSLVEAMLAGKPSIVSDIPVHREMVEDGETGRFVATGDVAGVTRAMSEMLTDPWEARQMGERAQLIARSRFDIELIAAQHAAFYRRVIGREESTGIISNGEDSKGEAEPEIVDAPDAGAIR